MRLENKKVLIPEIVICGDFPKDTEAEGSLQNGKPDIIRIIRVFPITHKPSVTFGNGKAEAYADMEFGIIYESGDNGKTAYTTVNTEFRQKLDIKSESETDVSCVFADIYCTRISCKLLGQRRFAVHAATVLRITAVGNREIETVDFETAPLDTFFKTKKYTYTCPCEPLEDIVRSDGGFALSKEAESIVAVFANTSVLKSEVGNGEVSVSMQSAITVIYLDGDGNTLSDEYVLPVDATLKSDSLMPDRKIHVSADAGSVAYSLESDDYGDMKNLKVNLPVSVNICVFKEKETVFAIDAFCGSKECRIENDTAKADSFVGMYSDIFPVSVSTDTDGVDTRILTSDVYAVITDSLFSENGLTVKGTVTCEIVAVSDGETVSYGGNGQFERTISNSDDEIICSVAVKSENVRVTVADGSITVNADIVLSSPLFTSQNMEFISNADTEERISDIRSGLVFVYPYEGETAWDIAKEYHVNPKKLVESNKESFDENSTVVGNVRFIKVNI